MAKRPKNLNIKPARKQCSSLPYRFDLFLAFVSFVFPFGWSVSGFPPSIELACACWTITSVGMLHYFFAATKNWKRKFVRWCLLIVTPALIIAVAWIPIKRQYRVQHSPVIEKKPDLEVYYLGNSNGPVLIKSNSVVNLYERTIYLGVANFGPVPSPGSIITISLPLNLANIQNSTSWGISSNPDFELGVLWKSWYKFIYTIPDKGGFVFSPMMVISTNFPEESLPGKITVYSDNATLKDIPVTFNLK